MNKYWKYTIFPTFLDAIRDCTYVALEDVDLTTTLNNIAKNAIQDFHFPKCSLAFEEDTSRDPLDGEEYGYYFTDDNIGDAEYKVIIACMKVYWVEAQITWDNNFKNPYYDKDIKGYSPANMLTAMKNTLEAFERRAKEAKYDYGRITKKGSIAWGKVNGN